MPQTDRTPCEHHLLTTDNCTLALVDLQPLMLFGALNIDRRAIIHNNVLLARAANTFGISVVITTIGAMGASGCLLPQLQVMFPQLMPIVRNRMNAWDDRNFVATIERTRHKTLVFAGLWTETCIALPTVQAIEAGYEVFVVEDCCGDMSRLAHDKALQRMVQAGARPVTASAMMLQWQYGWAAVDYDAAMRDSAKPGYGTYGAASDFANSRLGEALNARPQLPA